YYYHPSRHSAGQPIIAGWAWQWIAQVSFDRDSWTAPVDAARLHPLDDTDQQAARQIRALLARLPAGEAVPLFVFDGGYDPAHPPGPPPPTNPPARSAPPPHGCPPARPFRCLCSTAATTRPSSPWTWPSSGPRGWCGCVPTAASTPTRRPQRAHQRVAGRAAMAPSSPSPTRPAGRPRPPLWSARMTSTAP